MTNSVITGETPEQEKKRLSRVRTATLVGTTVEWYDFYLYATMASIVFGHVFFPKSDPQVATLSAFATFAVGFIARPLGGFLFGHLGDRIGRKKNLVITFTLMGIASFLIGCLPSYDTAGVWAPILLVVLRILQGLGAGAEYTSSAVNAYEHARADKRGAQGSWPALGLNIGLLISSAAVYLLSLKGDEFLINGGWRIGFLVSIVLVAIGLWVRSAVPESPEFEKRVKNNEQADTRLRTLFAKHWPSLLVVLLVALGYNAVSYIFKTFSIAYVKQFQGFSASTASASVTVAAAIAIIVVPIFGWLCDQIGSKKVIGYGGVISAVFAFIFLWLLSNGTTWGVFVALGIGTGIIAPMMFSAQGAFLSRQFPADVRSSGVGIGREVGTAISGALAPLGALSLVVASPTNSTFWVGVVLVFAGLLVIAGALADRGGKFSRSQKN
ncbi:MHS family MFS transporter [Brevibacterium sp. 50QC2O2]|uniref:MFS transporter n=1 Tax=unclassified Brevibacterium TaxID=2614124 RepID=UPI00211C6A07|nr:MULTISPECIES: MFS transporter [unclassified Brevibacterium]MCQ9368813.1 MHS family MFS transporter [Brevibacterium sp. 91QC2O2]MCQ9388542.1 MHS family MFS transporter [Brevibacterium sp. 50QC2O2]